MMNNNKIKKILAILTVLCFMFGFAMIPASAARPTTTKKVNTYVVSEDKTWVIDGENLFANTPVIYPGEGAEFIIEVEAPVNTPTRRSTVIMEIEKLGGQYDTDLANYIWLTITEDNGSGEIVYTGKLSDLPVKTRVISFVANSRTYKFEALFVGLNKNEYSTQYDMGTTDDNGWQNSLMTLQAGFEVRFRVETLYITIEDPTYGPTTTAPTSPETTTPEPTTDQQPTTTSDSTTTQEPTTPDPTTQDPVITTTTDEPTITEPTTVPGEPTTPEPTTPEPIVPTTTSAPDVQPTTTDLEDVQDATVPMSQFSTEPPSEYTSEGVTVEDEPYEPTVPDNKIPKDTFDSIDKMPQTGERTDPVVNLTAGLMLALIGGITIAGVKKKSKDEKETDI